MSQKKKKMSQDGNKTTLETNRDYKNTDNHVPTEIAEEFFPEPKKHPKTQYLDNE